MLDWFLWRIIDIYFRSANPAEISSFCKECDAEYSCHLHLRFKTNGL